MTTTDVSGSISGEDGCRVMAMRLLREEINAPFDLQRGELLRAHLFVLGDARFVLAITVHHIAADGWSLRVLAQELESLYGAYALGRNAPRPLQAQYQAYVAAQERYLKDAKARQLSALWETQFGSVADVGMPPDVAGDAASTRAGQYLFAVSAAQVQRLHEVARIYRTTAGVVATAMFGILLAQRTKAHDVFFGVPLWDRTHPRFHEAIGLFMNVAIVRLHVVDDSTVGSVIAAAQEQIQQAARYLKTPYPWLREQYAARAGASPAPFRFVFNFAAIDGVIITLPGLTTSRIDVFSDTPAVADMSVHVYGRGEGWCGLVVYKAEMYSATYIESIAHAYTHLLSAPLDEKVANVTVPS